MACMDLSWSTSVHTQHPNHQLIGGIRSRVDQVTGRDNEICLLGDILSFPELANSHIALMDIDPERLSTSEIVAHKVAEFFGAKPTVEATLDRRRARQ